MKIERGISIRQPWVEQILRGTKTKEYRSVPTTIRERVFLYASLKPADSPADWRQMEKSPGELLTGKVLGTVEVTGCRWNERRGCYEYSLERPKRFQRPRTPSNQPQPLWWRPRFK